MSFYGNIKNNNRTQFIFDKTYTSRSEMDEKCKAGDGVYVGRYVLVKYDDNIIYDNNPTYEMILYDSSNEYYYCKKSAIDTDVITESDIDTEATNKQIFLVGGLYYQYKGEADSVPVSNTNIDCSYFEIYENNYSKDKKYGTKRGYDATVWQKQIVDGNECYTMVADLNTVTPLFNLVQIAPTETPIAPYFDATTSTNVYYDLHMQPNWGFRIKVAKEMSASGTSDTKIYSDEKIVWEKNTYDATTKSVITKYSKYSDGNISWEDSSPDDDDNKIPADIYYNKAGFSKKIQSKSEISDKISISSTGKSGTKYNGETAIDTKELSIILPSIGNVINDLWDLIYPLYPLSNYENKTDTDNDDVSFAITSTTRMYPSKYYKWYDSDDNKPAYKTTTLLQNGYNTNAFETLGGSLNVLQDAMGMIIHTINNDDEINCTDNIYSSENMSLDDKKIYYDSLNLKYLRTSLIHEVLENDKDCGYGYFTYEKSTPTSSTGTRNKESFYIKTDSNTYQINTKVESEYSNGTITYLKQLHTQDGYIYWDSNDKIISDASNVISDIIKCRKKRLYELPEFTFKLNTVFGLILKMNQLLELDDDTTDIHTVNGALKQINNLLDQILERVAGQVVIFNDDSGLEGANLTGDNIITTSVDSAKGDCSITINHNKIYEEKNEEKIEHSKNTGISSNDNNSVDNYLYLKIPILDYDENDNTKAYGHVKYFETEKVELPFGYSTLEFIDTNSEKIVTKSATTVKDTLTFKQNKWINFSAEKDNENNPTNILIEHMHPYSSQLISSTYPEVFELATSEEPDEDTTYYMKNTTDGTYSEVEFFNTVSWYTLEYNYVLAEGSFNTKDTYYYKNSEDEYEEIKLINYEQSVYYYKDDSDEYVIDDNDSAQSDRQYYSKTTTTSDDGTITDDFTEVDIFIAGAYFTKQAAYCSLNLSASFDESEIYYLKDDDDKYIHINNPKEWKMNTYYIKNNKTYLAIEQNAISGKKYFDAEGTIIDSDSYVPEQYYQKTQVEEDILTPSFGESFYIPQPLYDYNGHIIGNNYYKVVLPELALGENYTPPSLFFKKSDGEYIAGDGTIVSYDGSIGKIDDNGNTFVYTDKDETDISLGTAYYPYLGINKDTSIAEAIYILSEEIMKLRKELALTYTTTSADEDETDSDYVLIDSTIE